MTAAEALAEERGAEISALTAALQRADGDKSTAAAALQRADGDKSAVATQLAVLQVGHMKGFWVFCLEQRNNRSAHLRIRLAL